MSDYSGKVVLITGASSGIGEALARRFAARGANLVLLARRLDKLEELARELSGGNVKAIAVQADVSQDGEVERAVDRAVQAFGRLDVAVANAGFGVAGKFEKLKLDDFRRQFEVNVFGVLRTIAACLPELKKTKGRVALIGSVLSEISIPESTPYCMSKHAVAGLSDGLRAELSRSGVSVTLILPGFINTAIFDVSNKNEPAKAKGKSRPPSWLVMSAPRAASRIERAISCRKRCQAITFHGKVMILLNRLFPGFVAWAVKLATSR